MKQNKNLKNQLIANIKLIKGKGFLLKENPLLIFLITLTFFLLLFLLVLNYINITLKRQVSDNSILNPPFTFLSADYPVKQNVLRISANPSVNNLNDNTINFLDFSAHGAIVIDNDSQVVLYGKNADLKLSMASTAKIMTALTALEYYQMNDILTIKSENVPGTVVGFKKDQKFTFESLLYAMLLPSGNDAAVAIAENYKRGEDEFVKKMNENARNFNLINTHFSDPSGLNDSEDYTTALDLARLASISIKNKTFTKVVSTKHKVISDTNNEHKYSLYNLNKLLGIDGVNGIKTGFTDEAGGILVTSKIENNHTLIIVVMKSKDRFYDTEKLLSLVSNKISFLDLNISKK